MYGEIKRPDEFILRRHRTKDKKTSTTFSIEKRHLDALTKLQNLLTLRVYGEHSESQYNFSATMSYALENWVMPKLEEMFPEVKEESGEVDSEKFFELNNKPDIPQVNGKV